MKIEMGIGWMPSETEPGQVRSARPGEYAAEIERLQFEYERADQSAKRLGAKWKVLRERIEQIKSHPDAAPETVLQASEALRLP